MNEILRLLYFVNKSSMHLETPLLLIDLFCIVNLTFMPSYEEKRTIALLLSVGQSVRHQFPFIFYVEVAPIEI